MDKKNKDNKETVHENVDESINGESGADMSRNGESDSGKKDSSVELAKSLARELNEKKSEIEKLEKEIETLKDTMQRRQADFENYKKRNLKLQEDQKKMVMKDLALDILLINDDLHRAIDASSNIPKGQSFEEAHNAFVEGVTMISSRIEGALEKHGIVEIDSMDREFDPNLDEAVEIEMSGDVKVDTVTKVYQKGFKMGDIVLRSSRVRVAKPLPDQAGKEDDSSSGGGEAGVSPAPGEGGDADASDSGDSVKSSA